MKMSDKDAVVVANLPPTDAALYVALGPVIHEHAELVTRGKFAGDADAAEGAVRGHAFAIFGLLTERQATNGERVAALGVVLEALLIDGADFIKEQRI